MGKHLGFSAVYDCRKFFYKLPELVGDLGLLVSWNRWDYVFDIFADSYNKLVKVVLESFPFL